jgi:hypothetical protein
MARGRGRSRGKGRSPSLFFVCLRQGIHSLIIVITISIQLSKEEAWRVVCPNNILDT